VIAPLVLAALAAGALPEGSAAYRFELGGQHAGAAELSIRCAGGRCTSRWTTRLRLPDEAGGDLAAGEVVLDTDGTGRSRGAPSRVTRDGATRSQAAVAAAIPAMIAPLVVTAAVPPDGARRCADAFDEETGERGRACAFREDGALHAEVLGVVMVVNPGADGFPESIAVPAQQVRWVRDPAAAPPALPPRLHGVRLPGPPERKSFCGVRRDPPPPPLTATLPEPAAEGDSCRAKTLDWLARAARADLPGRVAVGVAFDGTALAWHAWAEVRAGGRWVPVDPTFGQLPAAGPRFTLARYDPAVPAQRLAAGRRVLDCWTGPDAPAGRPRPRR
jgi:hypothetical protein